jgi:hypothetical protein
MKTAALYIIAVSLVLSTVLPALADEAAEPPTVETHLKRVALFKNGFGFFVREGTLTDDQRVAVLGPFAAPAHGTFWISTPSRAQLASAVARQVTVQQKVEARTMYELLRANVGKSVVLGDYGSGLTGTILSFAPDRPAIGPPNPYAMDSGPWSSENLQPGPGEFMLLDTPTGIVAVGANQYGQIRFASKDINTTLPVAQSRVQLEAALASPRRGDWLSVSYLARGITWAPSYLVDISEAKQARLSAKAEIIDEAEDLEGTHVDLVTGFPNLEFADVLSPMSMRTNLGQFLQSLAAGSPPAEMSVVTQNVAYSSEYGGRGGGGAGGRGGGGGPMPGYGAAAAGQVAEDLFLYPLENVTLKKNEVGYYPLFTETVPYTGFYEWKIPDYIGAEGYYAPQQQGQSPRPEIVWHSIRLTNTMKMPWTSAPAQLMKDGQIIGQDTLNYTAPTSETTVKITQAVGVKAEQTEVEVSREREAVRLYGDSFDRVTVTGTLQVTNYTRERISLEITKDLSGDVKATTPKAEDVTLARGLKAMNSAHELTWKIELKPGESAELTYTYQALIRR